MSYCRWNSDNFMCDVYVYADCYGGWTTHVAAKKRIIPPIPEPSYSMFTKVTGEWNAVAIIPLRKIGGPHDGESFNDDTAGKCAERLLYLRTVGYSVPQYAIDALQEEQQEN